MKIKSLKLKVYIILRLLIILCMIRQIILGNLANLSTTSLAPLPVVFFSLIAVILSAIFLLKEYIFI